MKKIISSLSFAIVLASCGLPTPKEQTIGPLNLTISVPSTKDIKTEAASQYSGASANFYIDKSRFEIKEIQEKSMPTDLDMLVEAVKSNNDFKSLLEQKTLPNGAFGVVVESTKGKNLLFYFTKESRFYKITEAFNKEGKYFDEAITAIGTLK